VGGRRGEGGRKEGRRGEHGGEGGRKEGKVRGPSFLYHVFHWGEAPMLVWRIAESSSNKEAEALQNHPFLVRVEGNGWRCSNWLRFTY